MKFENVTALAEANVYFDGQVVSHTILKEDGAKVTLGVILPGTYHFGTEAPENMDIVSGACSVVLDVAEGDSAPAETTEAGGTFHVPGNSGFTITVADAPCHYVCSFL